MRQRIVKYQKLDVKRSKKYWDMLMTNLNDTLREPLLANPNGLVYRDADNKYKDLLDDVIEVMPKLLTAKQLHIMQLLMDGFKQEKIARNLGVSESAVSQQLEASRKKLMDYFKNHATRPF